ncbi:MAG: toll/interleukin-1 receptor domain-containing protein [Flavobacteriaceae bacterium]|nr:MAG: toll/interleukin-1 receptor domain-containing protein [Flavobacteriaceae bacterium]
MSKETIFISYSRDDTDFVMKLATKLRNAGADIWLDQLDIAVGENWDMAVQNALKESENFLIVLSKSSVASNNVMDEVGYALSENKKVVPVLMEECEIPFRLQRRQFADLTGTDDVKGMKTLISALGLDSSVAKKLIDDDPKPEPKPEPKPGPKPDPKSDPKPKPDPIPPKPKSKLPIYIVAGIAAIAAIVFAFKDKIFPNQDQIAWDTTNIGNNIQIYEKYLTDFPEGEFVTAAKDSIAKKKKRIEDKLDNDDWQVALDTGTEVGFELYRNNHPAGIHIDKVDGKIVEVKNRDADDAAWNIATSANSVRSYIDYVMKDMAGKSKMNDAITNLKKEGKEGWLYSGTSSGSGLIFTVVKAVDGREIDSRTIPKTGDIVKAKESRRTYNSLSGGQAVGSQGRSVPRNSLAYVNNATVLGNAVFLQIVY